ncbi:MAG TPA: ABC transporter permease [Kofleriaceae bacterium]|nr:ABC transporter permease [Kofleriaceae bacterium]
MTTEDAQPAHQRGAAPRGALRRISTVLFRRRLLALWLLLTPPMLWLGVVYLGSLLAMLWQSAYSFDDFSMVVTPELTLANYRALFHGVNLDIIVRTVAMAAAVTVGSALIGFPVAYYIARYTRGAVKGVLYASVMLPMWASYIVKAYAWTVILAQGGVVYWVVNLLGLREVLDGVLALPVVGGSSLSTSNLGRFLVFTYVWLPFMILPIYAAIERVPESLLQASADLGARPWQTFRTVILPLTFPGVVAGSIFTFSLTLGDYIIPQLVGPPGYFIGTMVNTQQGSVGNLPMAAAFTVVPIVIIGGYLALARRLGAFDAL